MKGFSMMGNQSVQADQIKSQVGEGSEIRSFEDLIPGMKEYKEHQANIPQFNPDGSIGDHFNTYVKRVVHNMTGPSNPNLMGGGGGIDLIGGRGLAKGAMNAIKYILKSGGKTAVKKGTKT